MGSVTIVGAGTFGASLAWRLARAGVPVTLIDQFEPGDPRATSGGESRLVRCSHGDAGDYTAMARRAWTLWHELEAQTGSDLLVERGMCWFARRENGWEAASERTLRAQGVPVERVDPAALYPSFRGDDLAFTLYEPEAGAIRAADAVRALVAAARQAGAEVERRRVDADEAIAADVVVWACGAWLRDLFPGLVELRVTRQELLFLDGGPDWRDVPCFVDYDGAAYGTGDIDDLGVKVANDAEGPPLDPDADLPRVTGEGEQTARAYARRRFPALAAAPLKGSKTCRYEITADSNFIVAPHPERDGHWILGGGSGHGFKHGPAVAELLVAALLDGAPLPPEFGLHHRVPGRSLRTAGSGA